MSDLQISLLVIGGFMIAGVYLFNWWQERRFRRRAEHAFSREHEDVLLQDTPTQVADTRGRVEPTTMPIQPVAAVAARPNVATLVPAMIDPVIDFVVEVGIRTAADGADVHEELLALTADWDKPAQVAGYDAGSGEWRATGIGSGAQYSQLRFALQMANRAGCIAQDQLTAFRDVLVLEVGGAQRGRGQMPERRRSARDRRTNSMVSAPRSTLLSASMSWLAKPTPFSGAKIRALAESAGFNSGPDGVFHYARGERPADVVHARKSRTDAVRSRAGGRALSTTGITLLLDVPRVADGHCSLSTRMLKSAGVSPPPSVGRLVDDNRVALIVGRRDRQDPPPAGSRHSRGWKRTESLPGANARAATVF